jgi:putative endonuclease
MQEQFGKLTHCAYVLFSLTDGTLYIGHSSNLRQRLTEHFDGKVLSTVSRRPLRLIHVEYFLSDDDARRRERYFKTSKGKRALRLMLPDSLAAIRQLV